MPFNTFVDLVECAQSHHDARTSQYNFCLFYIISKLCRLFYVDCFLVYRFNTFGGCYDFTPTLRRQS